MNGSNYAKKIYNFQDDTLKIYARLWQFETWLRRMVYVELRAKYGDNWNSELKSVDETKNQDKSFIHMETTEQNDFSYAQLWQLFDLIEKKWECFSLYFPPKKVWKAKTQEITQIRNRVAHFRTCHSDDLQRLEQFLRDIDKGFWRFCTSYNNVEPALPPSSDLVTQHFISLDPLPWGEVGDGSWARLGHVDKSMVVGVIVSKSFRPWYKLLTTSPKETGMFYDISLLAFDRKFDAKRFLVSTRKLHEQLVTINFDSQYSIARLVIPAILGADKIIEITSEAVRWGKSCVGRRVELSEQNEEVLRWPEYVLSSKDPMTFLDPEMPCSFFNV